MSSSPIGGHRLLSGHRADGAATQDVAGDQRTSRRYTPVGVELLNNRVSVGHIAEDNNVYFSCQLGGWSRPKPAPEQCHNWKYVLLMFVVSD